MDIITITLIVLLFWFLYDAINSNHLKQCQQRRILFKLDRVCRLLDAAADRKGNSEIERNAIAGEVIRLQEEFERLNRKLDEFSDGDD